MKSLMRAEHFGPEFILLWTLCFQYRTTPSFCPFPLFPPNKLILICFMVAKYHATDLLFLQLYFMKTFRDELVDMATKRYDILFPCYQSILLPIYPVILLPI